MGQEVLDGFLGLPETKIFFVPDGVDNVDYFSKDLLVEEHHQFHQKVAELIFLLQLLDEVGLLAVPEEAVALDGFVDVFGLGLGG